MKNVILIFASVILLFSCSTKEEPRLTTGVYINPIAFISVIEDDTHIDLLDPEGENPIDIFKIRLEFPSHDFDRMLTLQETVGPEYKLLRQKDDEGVYYVAVSGLAYPLIGKPNEVEDVIIHWPDGTQDKVTYYFALSEEAPNSFLRVRNAVNDVTEPLDERGNSSEYITIYK